MRKSILSKIAFGFLHHCIAAILLVIVAGILFNSYITVESMNGTKSYYLNPLTVESEFEDTQVFSEIFQTAVSDVIRLVTIRDQIETEDYFDPRKHIDINAFAKQNNLEASPQTEVVYELEDLLKWGMSGLEYHVRYLSMSDFVNYFGDIRNPNYYELDQFGQLHFRGYHMTHVIDDEEKYYMLVSTIKNTTNEELEEMVFSYIVAQNIEGISVSREDDGRITVYIEMLHSRYTDAYKKHLLQNADNWKDYMLLQKNLAQTIEILSKNYEDYQRCNHLYQEKYSNLIYVVRMMTEDGTKTYTNEKQLKELSEAELTEHFSEYRRYCIYYPDSLEYMGNTTLTESDIHSYLYDYEYDYPDTTHIWIGVDTAYSKEGDAFYYANGIFSKVVPNIFKIIIMTLFFILVWAMIFVYRLSATGVEYTADGDIINIPGSLDKIWLEIIVALAIALYQLGTWGYQYLMKIADEVYIMNFGSMLVEHDWIREFGSFALYGFLCSFFVCSLVETLVRRIKHGSIMRSTLIYALFLLIKNAVVYVFSHKNSLVSTLIPYNVFLLMHILLLLLIWRCYSILIYLAAFLIVILIIADSIIGYYLLKRNAELLEIMKGITKIRQGNVEYKIDTESMMKFSKEMAESVNHIGDGIRHAVQTSMKDEQMKADLITNVSHDIKTPLTSIINYVDLLKRLKITEEPAKRYIDVLDTKSKRLKQLTEDLVEASKISSGNIELVFEQINMVELMKQSIGEFSEKFEEAGLTVIFHSDVKEAYVWADSRRTWRVFENILNNICKYAMENTRVYTEVIMDEREIICYFKNISKAEMNIRAEDLTERFIRGDSARTTEGSGLGLYIAKSLIEVQNGTFAIELDGDLFKVRIGFPVYRTELEDKGLQEESIQ